jgi:hypothetical protein
MKKTKQFIMLMVMAAFMSSTAFAQLPAGSYAKDISMKKLTYNGAAFSDTTCTIYQYTNAGKAVIMDVSAIWCAPCWSYHQSGALETLYSTNGPSGTNEVMVYYVEGDGGSIAELNGGTGSQGNWVTGTYYPILPTIAPNTNQVCIDYAIGYFPTVYLICPDRSVTEIGQVNAAALIAGARACPTLSTNTLDAKIFKVSSPGSTIYCGSFTPKMTIQNYGTTAITSATIKMQIDNVDAATFNLTGANIGRLEIAEIIFPAYSSASLTNGTHTVKYIIESPNAGTDLDLANNTKTVTINNVAVFGAAPVTESFAATTFPPTSWSKDDNNDGAGWARNAAHSGCAKIDFYSIGSGESDYLMLPPVDLTSATSMNLTFKVSHAMYNTVVDKLEVEVSSDCGATWTSKYNKSGSALSTTTASTSAFAPTTEAQWRQETVSLSSFAGQAKVMIRFKSTSGYGNNCYVDEINLSSTAAVNSNELVSGMNLYPNPSNSVTSLEFFTQKSNAVNLIVVNAIGEVVYTSEINATQGFNTVQIPSNTFNSGVYFVSLKGENTNSTQKLVIQK